ncbi:hypothetical protein [Devosia enhydra]|nr:hypothetical protein [Devosia enhydra]
MGVLAMAGQKPRSRRANRPGCAAMGRALHVISAISIPSIESPD